MAENSATVVPKSVQIVWQEGRYFLTRAWQQKPFCCSRQGGGQQWPIGHLWLLRGSSDSRCRSNGLYLLKLLSISLVWIHTGHVSVAGLIWTLLSYQTHLNQPGTGPSAHTVRKHSNFQTVFWLLPWIQWTVSVQLISISVSLLWTHNGHVMCSWTHLDPSFIPITPKNCLDWPRSHKKAWQLWDSFGPLCLI